MSSDAYSSRVRAYFGAPAHAGALDDGHSVLVDDQGVRLQLSATVDDGKLGAMRFRAWGCPHTIAVTEAVCEALEGRPVAELLEFSSRDLMEELSVPVEKTGRILVIEDAVRALGRSFGDGP
jgi:NifU-like protein involved in Fe-S cluster formation